MADSYLTISTISADDFMIRRVTACAAQQGVSDTANWVATNSYLWAAAPGWAEKWDYAVNTGVESPGEDLAVITDADILSQVQSMLSPGAS